MFLTTYTTVKINTAIMHGGILRPTKSVSLVIELIYEVSASKFDIAF